MGSSGGRAVAVAFAAGMLLASCTGTASDSSDRFSSVGASISGAGGVRSDRDGPDDRGAVAAPGDQDASSSVDPAALIASTGRDLVVTGAMTIDVEDLAQAQARATAAIDGLGGIVADEQTSFGEEARSTITYRIPAEQYSAAVEALADIGDVRDQTRQTADVTDQLVDLESRLTTARASVERLRSFFEEAGDLTQVALLEGELLKRETEVEQLTASLRAMEGRVALSTLVVTWQEPTEEEEAPVAAADEDELPTFLDGLSTGWTMLLRGGQVTGAALGLALPFAPVALVGFVVHRGFRRLTRGSRRRPSEATA